MEVETADAIYIFEFKLRGSPSDAIAQIKGQGYTQKYNASNKNMFLIGAVINEDERTLGEWEIERVK